VKKSNLLALQAILVYCLVAGSWILLSDWLLARFDTDPHWLNYFQTGKGLSFVAVSAVFFFFLLRGQLRRLEKEATQRKQVEIDLLADEEKLQAIFDAEPDCLKLLDSDAVLREVNPAGLQIMEADNLATVVGHSVLDLVVPEYREAVRAMLTAAANGEKRNLEFKIVGLKGTPRWIDMYAVPVHDPATGKKRVLAVSRDITDRKLAEAAILHLARQNEMILNTAGEGIWGLDAAGNATFVNPAAAHLLGYDPKELIGRNLHSLLHHTAADGRPHPIEKCPIQMALRDGQAHRCRDDIFWRKDGSSFPVQYACSPMVDNGKVVGEVVVFSDMTEQKRLEAELASREQRLNAFFSKAPAGLALLDTRLRYVQINDRVAEANGVPVKDHLGKTVREVLPRFAPVIEPLLEKVLATGESILNIELSGEKPGRPGVLQHLIESFFPVFGVDGKPDGVGVIFVEITERKRAEEALRESENKFSKIFQSSPAAISLSTINEGRYLDVNREFLNMLQRSRDEVVGHTALEIGVWNNPEQRAAIIGRIREQGEVRNVELEIRGQAGRITHILWFAEALVIDGKNYLLGTALDITEYKHAKDELQWKTAFLEAQVDSALDGILVVDSRGKKILQNQRMADLWKFPPDIDQSEDDTRRLQFALTQTKTPEEFARKVAYLYAHPDEISQDEIELVDGTLLDRYSSPVRDKAGKHYGRIWTFRDITGRRKLESQLRQSQKMEAIGQLASGVAHDFNNILAVIQLQAGLLKAEQNLTPGQLNFAAEIEAASQRAANLTRQLLLFSRKQALQLRDLDLNEIVTNITRMLQRILGAHIQTQFKYSCERLMIHADAGMIDQILLNLTVNARDAMPKGGQLVIETSAVEFDAAGAVQTSHARPGRFACLSVSDTGCGIPPEIMPRIFDPFFTTKEVGQGTGLGLATVFGIVQQHQGWINVQSEVGSGTTFRIYLPRLDQSPDNQADSSSPASVRGGTETILLVEDDSALRASMRITLSRLGYQVLEAATGLEALKIWKLQRCEIRLLLADLVVPGGMTGRELAGLLLQQEPRLKVVYCSGYSPEMAGKNFVLQEGVNFLAKPFETYKLAQTVRNCLDGVIPQTENIKTWS